MSLMLFVLFLARKKYSKKWRRFWPSKIDLQQLISTNRHQVIRRKELETETGVDVFFKQLPLPWCIQVEVIASARGGEAIQFTVPRFLLGDLSPNSDGVLQEAGWASGGGGCHDKGSRLCFDGIHGIEGELSSNARGTEGQAVPPGHRHIPISCHQSLEHNRIQLRTLLRISSAESLSNAELMRNGMEYLILI